MFERDELVGMSAYIAIDEGRGVLEIGNTYIVSEKRGTGFNRMVKQLMIDRAFSCGFRRIEFRVDARNRRSQAAMAKLKSEEHTSELQSLMRISYAVFCLKNKNSL